MMYNPGGQGPFRHAIIWHSRGKQNASPVPKLTRLRALIARLLYPSGRIHPPPSTRPPSRA